MSNNLIIGTGGCGNKLLESFLSILDKTIGLQSTYDGLFINSNTNEMNKLPHFNASINGLCINGNGTGRNPKKAKQNIKNDKSKLLNYFVSRIANYNSVYMVSSGDGGFGNGSISIIAKRLRGLSSSIDINLLIAMPKLSSRKASLENALDLYEDILELMGYDKNGKRNNERPIINSVQFIDNDKMTEEDMFNEKVMRLFLESIELGNGALDSNDAKIVNSANGYKVIFELTSGIKTIQQAVDLSTKNSPFVMPSNSKCTHLGVVVKEDDYNKNEAIKIFNPKDFDKADYGNKNIIVLGGCKLPNEHMNMIKESLDQLNKEVNNSEEEFVISFKGRNKNEENETVNNIIPIEKSIVSEDSEYERARKMLEDDWD